MNAGLVAMEDVSFNGKLSVAGDVYLNCTLQVGEDIDLFSGFLNQY